MNGDKNEFDSIRPYEDAEVPWAIADLIADEKYEAFFKDMFPIFDYKKFINQLQHVKSIYEFQSVFAYSAVKFIIKKSIHKHSTSGLDKLKNTQAYLFISNHRDIVLDSSLMNFVLFEKGHNTCQTAIGDNLYVSSMITHLLKLNKSFTVKRNVQPRAFYDYSKTLSAYIVHVIKDRNESVWIAQREGRAKDGNDKTQYSLLKMLMMNFERSDKKSFFDLNVIPVAVSYEYDPCDYLKAIELYMADHELPFEKTPDKDLKSMLQGIMGYKGNVHIAFGDALNDDSILENGEFVFNDWVKSIAEKIDKQIYSNYYLWNSNFIAYDILYKSKRFSDRYSEQDKKAFKNYITSRIEMIPENIDTAEIRSILLTMYSNPVKNRFDNLLIGAD